MTETTRDPVHRARYAFEPRGEDIVVETWLEAGGGLPAHFHPRQVEHWSVLEGEVRFQLGSEKMTLRPEDGEVVVEPGTKHALKNESGREAHLSCLATPAFGLQPFLEESAAAAREGLFMRGGIPRNPKGARWAATFLKKYSDDVVMTFPPRFVQRTMTGLLARG